MNVHVSEHAQVRMRVSVCVCISLSIYMYMCVYVCVCACVQGEPITSGRTARRSSLAPTPLPPDSPLTNTQRSINLNEYVKLAMGRS